MAWADIAGDAAFLAPNIFSFPRSSVGMHTGGVFAAKSKNRAISARPPCPQFAFHAVIPAQAGIQHARRKPLNLILQSIPFRRKPESYHYERGIFPFYFLVLQ